MATNNRYGFVLPKAEIVPTGQEAFQAALVFMETALDSKMAL